MSIKEKVVVYPFDMEFMPILRCHQFNEKYDVVGLVSPNGWGIAGRDAGFVDSGENIGIKVSKDFEPMLDMCDTVIFSESDTSLDFNKIIKSKIEKAIENNKNIICTINIENETYKYFLKKCNAKGKYFKYYNCLRDQYEDKCSIEYINEIETPVIFVVGMSERTNKFAIQLGLRELYISMGYNVSLIGSRKYCEMLGFHSLPAFMYNKGIEDFEKIVMFNHYIKNLEINERPDLIIIGIPGGLFPMNNQFTNRFGMMACKISRAITPDATVLSTLYEEYTAEYFKELSTVIKYRYSVEIDCYNLSNTKFDWSRSKQNNKMSYLTIDSKHIDEKKQKLSIIGVPIFNSLSIDDVENMGKYLLDKLSSYSEVESL